MNRIADTDHNGDAPFASQGSSKGSLTILPLDGSSEIGRHTIHDLAPIPRERLTVQSGARIPGRILAPQ
jgi:hypothetical protein